MSNAFTRKIKVHAVNPDQYEADKKILMAYADACDLINILGREAQNSLNCSGTAWKPIDSSNPEAFFIAIRKFGVIFREVLDEKKSDFVSAQKSIIEIREEFQKKFNHAFIEPFALLNSLTQKYSSLLHRNPDEVTILKEGGLTSGIQNLHSLFNEYSEMKQSISDEKVNQYKHQLYELEKLLFEKHKENEFLLSRAPVPIDLDVQDLQNKLSRLKNTLRVSSTPLPAPFDRISFEDESGVQQEEYEKKQGETNPDKKPNPEPWTTGRVDLKPVEEGPGRLFPSDLVYPVGDRRQWQISQFVRALQLREKAFEEGDPEPPNFAFSGFVPSTRYCQACSWLHKSVLKMDGKKLIRPPSAKHDHEPVLPSSPSNPPWKHPSPAPGSPSRPPPFSNDKNLTRSTFTSHLRDTVGKLNMARSEKAREEPLQESLLKDMAGDDRLGLNAYIDSVLWVYKHNLLEDQETYEGLDALGRTGTEIHAQTKEWENNWKGGKSDDGLVREFLQETHKKKKPIEVPRQKDEPRKIEAYPLRIPFQQDMNLETLYWNA